MRYCPSPAVRMKKAGPSTCRLMLATPSAGRTPSAAFPWRNPALASGRFLVPPILPVGLANGEVAARRADGGVSHPSTTSGAGGPPPHRFAAGRIYQS
jgi:hypothetical protein